MINPAGDAKHAGRQIDGNFERGITLQCAEQLKELLEKRYPHISVILTRFPGEVVPHLQNANFANRFTVDLFLSIHFYQETETKPKAHLYHFSYDNTFISAAQDFAFYTFDKAYLFNYDKTQTWATLFYDVLKQDAYTKHFDITSPTRFPFKPLIGIKAPAIAFEASIKQKHDWQTYLEPIAQAVGVIQRSITSTNT
jgi:N-acetylmuramoyl-L-alanine amidase